MMSLGVGVEFAVGEIETLIRKDKEVLRTIAQSQGCREKIGSGLNSIK